MSHKIHLFQDAIDYFKATVTYFMKFIIY